MDQTRKQQQPDAEKGQNASSPADAGDVPADAERTLEREEDRGVARADHNLEENTGSEVPRRNER